MFLLNFNLLNFCDHLTDNRNITLVLTITEHKTHGDDLNVGHKNIIM